MTLNKLELIAPEEISNGINTVLDNAAKLISDGDILYEEKRFPRAYTLYQLANEEIGKSRLLYALFLSIKMGEKIDYNDYNKEFKSHIRKSKGAITVEMSALISLFRGEKDIDKRNMIKEAYQILVDEEKNIDQLNDNKNFSLYVSIIDSFFVTPEQKISEAMANKLRTNAHIRLRASSIFIDMALKTIDILSTKIKEMRNDPNYVHDSDIAELMLSARE